VTGSENRHSNSIAFIGLFVGNAYTTCEYTFEILPRRSLCSVWRSNDIFNTASSWSACPEN